MSKSLLLRGAMCAVSVVSVAFAAVEEVIESFEGEELPANTTLNDVDAAIVPLKSGTGLAVHFHQVDWPNVFFSAPDGAWDWSHAEGLAVDVFNPESEEVNVCVRVDNAGADGAKNCVTGSATALPGETTVLKVPFGRKSAGPFWGMRGIPIVGPIGRGESIDRTRIVAFQVFLPRPDKPHTLIIDNVRLFGSSEPVADRVPFPFIDRFGQYKHDTWPGKLLDEAELAERRESERVELGQHPRLPGRDAYGGWADGPTLEATGRFRTERIDGKWWFVTPDGHLFLSMGMDCVGTWSQTFVEQRDSWFEWLPAADDPVFGPMYGNVSGAHSMADIIGGKGRTFGFYRANLARKYGKDWPTAWRETSCRRLAAWGFNTIGNWSQGDVVEECAIPFVATTGVSGSFRRIEGGGGYWAKMPDVYHPDFAKAVDAGVGPGAKRYADNPRCIGLFADNELSWEAIRKGTLASPPDQPCRVAQVAMLKEKYGTLEALNAAWETQATDWESLRAPDRPNEACNADLEAFVYTFAHRYFTLVNDAVKREAPQMLYLGCRFSSAPPSVVRACADVADVVSFNLYRSVIRPEQNSGSNDLGKPLLIGEFHFGALDRGMFHTGLVAAANQEERAKSYMRYVRSVVDHPNFVGCHWFQYVDEPVTGRWFDGENYNIGFVTVVDSPYPEMVEAARTVHKDMYERRYTGAKRRDAD